MGLIQVRNRINQGHHCPPLGRDTSGIALFMVIAAVSVLAILVTEFTYIASISQSIAFGGLDQAKAHYLAKSGLKLSLLRLKAYQQISSSLGSLGLPAGTDAIPKGVVEKIWNFPFFYPIPTNIPGMSASDKDVIDKFQKTSGLEGRFSALIESESSKYNLNLLSPGYALAPPSPTPSPSPSVTPVHNSSAIPSPLPSPNPEAAKENLNNFLNTILTQKSESDPEFASNYRDFRVEEFVDLIASWVDRTHNRRTPTNLDRVPMKRAPFYSVSELHMLPMIDDELYQLFAPNLSATATSGININTMKEATLRTLVPQLTKDEITEFFKFRDSEEADHLFQKEDQFFEYLTKNVAIFHTNPQAISDLKTDFEKRNIRLVTDETQFKITVRADVNSASRTIEAWVTLEPSTSLTTPPPPPVNANNVASPGGVNPNGPPPKNTGKASGLKITFIKML